MYIIHTYNIHIIYVYYMYIYTYMYINMYIINKVWLVQFLTDQQNKADSTLQTQFFTV